MFGEYQPIRKVSQEIDRTFIKRTFIEKLREGI